MDPFDNYYFEDQEDMNEFSKNSALAFISLLKSVESIYLEGIKAEESPADINEQVQYLVFSFFDVHPLLAVKSVMLNAFINLVSKDETIKNWLDNDDVKEMEDKNRESLLEFLTGKVKEAQEMQNQEKSNLGFGAYL